MTNILRVSNMVPVVRKKKKKAEDAIIFSAKYFHEFQKSYKKSGLMAEWQRDSLDLDRLDTLGYGLTCYKEEDECRNWLDQQGVENSVIEAIIQISCEKFIHLSITALKKILPLMEEGLRYDEAVAAIPEYFHHSQRHFNIKKSRYLPPFSSVEIRNSVVRRALNQARKLVNAIVSEYGSPTAVHIEMARELSKSKRERDEITKGQKKFQDEKNNAVEYFAEQFNRQPRGLELLKMRLYREQLGQCPYSFRMQRIDINRLCEENYVEIDHILPYSRTFDDSINNKVLVLIKENRNKGNRTPYEYLDGANNSERWQHFVHWVENAKLIRQAKRDRLLCKDFSPERSKGFRRRHLSDTRYICRLLKEHIETHLNLSPKQTDEQKSETCVVVSGQLTAYLRAHWGLVKLREDSDLHHAMDAAVVAACSQGMVNRLSNYSKSDELEAYIFNNSRYMDPETDEIIDVQALKKLCEVEQQFPQPWPYFRTELMARLSPNPEEILSKIPNYLGDKNVPAIRVSRMSTRRSLGSAHKDTIHSIGKDNQFLADGYSTIRTELKNLKLSDIENIVGYEIRATST